MAFVARNDQHGNEIMRVMLSTEPGQLTVASCQNLRINCTPQMLLTSCSEGRYDHRQRFHYYAKESQTWCKKSHSVVEPIAQQEREKERDRTHKRLREKQSLSDDDSSAWNSVEINAHSTLVSARKAKSKEIDAAQRERSTHFHSWLAEKNKSKQQQEENRRLAAQQKDQQAAERARLAHEKYRSWLNAKSSSTKVHRAKSDLSSAPISPATSRQSLPADEAKRRLHNWKQEKLEKLKAQRQKRKEVEEKQQLIESARRERSAEAWEQWVDAAKKKPRPVPMGQGLDSLRGSIAPLYTNPNEWQPLVDGSTRRHCQQPPQQREQQSQLSQRSQQSQPTTARNRPDYGRLERLAQPRRQQSRPTPREEKPNESLKLQEENPADKSGSHLGNTSRAADAETNSETLRNQSFSIEKAEEQLEVEIEDLSQPLQPRSRPIIWDTKNAQRVRELRELISPQEEPELPRQLRDDQLEQLRKHQDLQNSKILPRKYQVKREKLREKLKAWVEEGKLLPERHPTDDEDKNLTQTPQPETPKDISQHDSNTNESKGQRSEDQMQSTARKSVSTEVGARSTDPTRLFKLKEKESKGMSKSRPWR